MPMDRSAIESALNNQLVGKPTGVVFFCWTVPWKKTGCLGYIGDYTTQLFRDYIKPLLYKDPY